MADRKFTAQSTIEGSSLNIGVNLTGAWFDNTLLKNELYIII